MSEDELRAIEARLLCVPAPPWGEFCESGDWWIQQKDEEGSPIGTVVCSSNVSDMDLEVADFIVAAPADITALIAEVQRLRAALRQAALMKTIRGARVIVNDALTDVRSEAMEDEEGENQ